MLERFMVLLLCVDQAIGNVSLQGSSERQIDNRAAANKSPSAMIKIRELSFPP
jgi:hypothetical protein